MPSNQNIDPFQYNAPSGIQTMFTSGTLTANVSIIESTGGQLQGTQGSLGNIEGASYSGTVGAFPEVFSNAVVASGNLSTQNQFITSSNFISGTSSAGIVINAIATSSGISPPGGSGGGTQGVTVGGSGYTYPGSGLSVFAPGSGAFTPAGWFLVNVPTSGSPWVKVPFFNS